MKGSFRSSLARYGLALVVFVLIVGASAILRSLDIRVNFGIPMIAGIVIVAWYAGRRPGLLLVTLFIAVMVYSSPITGDASVLQWAFGHFTNLAFLVFIVLLISERKAVGTKARSTEEREALLFENNPFPMWVYDLETLRFLAVNNAASVFYGYSRDEFLSMTITDIRPESERATFLESLRRTPAKVDGPTVWKHQKRDATIIDAEVISHEIDWDDRRARFVLANDVTEKIKAGAAMRESEDRLKTVITNLNEGLVISDLGGQLLHWNRAALDMHGFPTIEDGLLELPQFTEIFELSDMDGKVVALDDWPLARIIRGERLQNLEIVVRRIDTDWKRVFNYGGQVVREASGKDVAFVTISDITVRKHAEDQIRRLNETLEQRVEERTAQLAAANRELESFSYSVSHDLRAPLRHMNGFSQALLEDYSDRLDEQGKAYLREVRAASTEMAHLIDDVLQLARVTRSEMRSEPVDLSALARTTINDLRKRDGDRTVETQIADALETRGDKRLLNVMLTNLLGNAWKFTANKDAAEIVFGKETHKDESVFYIRDNGAGFDMAYVGKLFGAFQRLHSNDEFEGTGIGLATVQRIVNRHGGRVWAEGAVDKGATIYFVLPGVKETANGEQQNDTAGRG